MRLEHFMFLSSNRWHSLWLEYNSFSKYSVYYNYKKNRCIILKTYSKECDLLKCISYVFSKAKSEKWKQLTKLAQSQRWVKSKETEKGMEDTGPTVELMEESIIKSRCETETANKLAVVAELLVRNRICRLLGSLSVLCLDFWGSFLCSYREFRVRVQFFYR